MPFDDQDQSLVPPVNPRAFDAGANPAVNGATNTPNSDVGMNRTTNSNVGAPVGQNTPVRPMIDPAQAATVAHHASIGSAFRSIMGNQVEYKQDPTTGAMTQTPVPQKPGQLWRSMLAGVLLGGAAGSQTSVDREGHVTKGGTFLSGIASGGEAVVSDAERKDAIKRENARQEGADQRSARSANTEEDMRRAQIAFSNAQTLKENQDMQFSYEKHAREDAEYKVKWPLENLALHNNAAALGNVQIQPFINADPTLLKFKDVSESGMHDLMKNNPDAMHLMWEPTGVNMTADKDGNPTYEATYSAVDPKGTVKLTTAWIDAAKKAGLDQVYGENTWNVLVANKSLPAPTYLAANQKVQELTNQKTATRKQQFDEDKEHAEVQELRATAADRFADAAYKRKKAGEEQAGDSGILKLQAAHGNVKDAKLTNKEHAQLIKLYLGEEKDANSTFGILVNSGQGGTKQGQDAYQRLLQIQSQLNQLGGIVSSDAPPPETGELPPAAKGRLTNYEDLLKQDNIPSGSTDAWDYLSRIKPNKTDDPKVFNQAMHAALQKHAIVPWAEVLNRASMDGVTRNEAARRFKSEGFKLEFDSDDAKQKSDIEKLKQMMGPANVDSNQLERTPK